MGKGLIRAVSAMLSAAMLMGVCACSDGSGKEYVLSDSTTDLMAGVKASSKALAFKSDESKRQEFEKAYNAFAFKLFRECTANDSKENTLVSPLSVMTALAMTQNGADGNTLEQMSGTLGMNKDELNQYLGAYLSNLPSSEKSKFFSANSIWLRKNSLRFNDEFLQTNADYFDADIFESKFDDKTLADINQWVSDNTGGMIPKILDEVPDAAVMYLINALSFDAEWKKIYGKDQLYEDEFTDTEGQTQKVTMMCGTESGYLDDGMAQGFVKPYASGYSFVAMLPNEGVTLENYIKKMKPSVIIKQIRKEEQEPVIAAIPKFSADYSAELSGVLSAMGMNDPFNPDQADFSVMADVNKGDLYISRVIHKTAIQVDERGTKAGAEKK